MIYWDTSSNTLNALTLKHSNKSYFIFSRVFKTSITNITINAKKLDSTAGSANHLVYPFAMSRRAQEIPATTPNKTRNRKAGIINSEGNVWSFKSSSIIPIIDAEGNEKIRKGHVANGFCTDATTKIASKHKNTAPYICISIISIAPPPPSPEPPQSTSAHPLPRPECSSPAQKSPRRPSP